MAVSLLWRDQIAMSDLRVGPEATIHTEKQYSTCPTLASPLRANAVPPEEGHTISQKIASH